MPVVGRGVDPRGSIGGVDGREAAERFARVWEAGWVRGDVESIAALYAEDCVHRSMPFRPLHVGRAALIEYLRESFAEDRAVDVRFGTPIVDGDRAVVEFRVVGEGSTLAGCAFVRFGTDGLVAEVRDYWHEGDGEPTGRLFF
ncbi:nuclear transport factor 2 family protein [Actinomadura barringtoniae]|uniref:nuclear transport factor 2 family protein n=1 Tax=Actinomadura barringtoniae TaxID=1427535 RepID=UPI001FB6551A|nr:nuclear transport factor 2 family protein [Actinomadura barringtoniae]